MLTQRLTMPPRARDVARQLLDRGCVVIDTETTGLGPGARLVEVSIVNAYGAILLDTLLNPEAPIPMQATAIHGIRDRDVRDRPTLPDVWLHLSAILAGRPVVAYNAAFDQKLLDQHAACYGLPAQEKSWHCAMKLWSAHAGLSRWVKLENACSAASVPLSGAHRAMADCRATLGLLRAMAV